MSNKTKRLMGFVMFWAPIIFLVFLPIEHQWRTGVLWNSLNALAEQLRWICLQVIPLIVLIALVIWIVLARGLWAGDFDNKDGEQ